MNFEEVCWLDALFERMMNEARKARNKNQVVAIIREHHVIFKQQKLNGADEILARCP